jgi:VanZ family protein
VAVPTLARNRRALGWAIVTLAWALVIFVLSAQPNLRFLPEPGWDFTVRKVGHMVVFGLLAVFIWRTAAAAGIRAPALVAFVLTVLYATSDEVHQGFTSGRHPAWEDVAVDAAGALIALLAAARLGRGLRRPGSD